MALIKSISGIRGTIGGSPSDNLTPVDIVECTAAFGLWIKEQGVPPLVVVGRDARISGKIVSQLAVHTLLSLGIDVIDIGLSTTPTVEMAVPSVEAGAGIIFTASHNPKNWNALKFLNHKGEFISKADGARILEIIAEGGPSFSEVDELGKYRKDKGYIDWHVEKILELPLVDVDAIKQKKYKIVVDAINSTGSISIPPLLARLGCEALILNDSLDGHFAHNPEPLPQHLSQLTKAVLNQKADLGIIVDPDVDRLAFVCENGEMFGEEYTLVAIADYYLQHKKGNTVSNLSSTRALRDVTQKNGGEYFASAVGEVNVVEKMKEVNAIIGGEGNGGIIVPELHYGRDALAGIAIFLSHLAKSGKSISALRASYPSYQMVKDKIALSPGLDVDALIDRVHQTFKHEDCNTIDGLKINFPNSWVHLRKSNTEPIIRVYAEAETEEKAKALVERIKGEVLSIN